MTFSLAPAARAAGYADIYTGLYGDTYGVPPALPAAAAALNLGGTWQDITPDVFAAASASPAVTITRGRPDEISQAAPATLAATLNNRGGKYSPRNPLGPYYGLLGRNTPVRCSVGAAEPYLRLENDTTSGASCPDAPALEITGTLDVRIDVNLSSYLPCVLASKWSAATGAAVTGPGGGILIGATCNQACYPGSASQIAAGRTMDGIVGRPVAETSQKVFFETGSTTTFPATPLAKDKGLMDAKVALWLCYKPLPDGSQLGVLTASISAYLAYALAAGAPQPKIVLWQEPQNSGNVALGLPNAAAYKTCMQNHYPAIKALAGSPAVVYCSASHLGEAGVASWYPGDAVCDEVAQDLYGYTWKHGVTLATLQSIANAASPKKPLSHAEAGTALTQAQANTMSQADVANYFAYDIAFFQARAAAGLPGGAWMWFNGLAGAAWNTIQPGDSRIPLIRSLYDTLTASSGGGASNGRSWALTLNGDGTLTFWWTTDGTLATLHKATSTAPIPLGRTVIRVYGQATAPASVTFWTAPGGSAGAPGNAAVQRQLGAPVPQGALQLFQSSAPLQIGYNSAFTADQPAYGGMTGQVFEFQVQAAGDTYRDVYGDVYGAGGAPAVVADPGFPTPGATSFTDGPGNPWQLTGTAEISGADYRFHGELSSLPVTWDPAAIDVQMPIQAGGLLRRLSQGSQPPAPSALKRAVLGDTTVPPVVYWPCEDGQGAGRLGPAIGPAGMTGDNMPSLAADSSFACSLPLPTYAFSAASGPVPPYAGSTAAVVRFLMHVPSSPSSLADNSVICRFNTTGSAGDVTLRWKTGGQLRFTGYGGGGYLWDTGASNAFAVNGELCLVSLELTQSAGKLAWQLAVLAVGASAPVTVNGTVNNASPGNVTTVHLGVAATSLVGTALGHVFVQPALEPVTNFASALTAHAGETCATRFARLCAENGIAARIYGPPLLDVAMGPQAPDTFTNLLQLCETTGRGQMYEPRQALALGYRTARSLCQQQPAVTLDASQGHLDSLAPTDDDQRTQNDVTVSSQGGSSFRAVLADGSPMSTGAPPGGTGDYATSYTVNPATDAQLADIAGWALHTGTVNQERYPAVAVDLMNGALASLIPKLQALDIGGFLNILSPPAFLPPGGIRQLVYGVAPESIGTRVWQMTFNCAPETPYETGIFGDPVFGRMDTDGSALDADIGTGDTTFTVDITGPSGIGWTTNPAGWPFDILMGGEQMTVTAVPNVGGIVSGQQQFTVIRSVNGIVKAHPAGEPLSLAHQAIVALA